MIFVTATDSVKLSTANYEFLTTASWIKVSARFRQRPTSRNDNV